MKAPDSIIFETSRLIFRKFKREDKNFFYDMMGNPNVMNPIPLTAMSKNESHIKLKELIENQKKPSKKLLWAISIQNSTELIGVGGVLVNDDKEPELAYRIREKYWSKGYGTEIAGGLINYCFTELDKSLVTADAWLKNKKSIAILSKFMTPKKEFFNKDYQCFDRRYVLTKTDWIKAQNKQNGN